MQKEIIAREPEQKEFELIPVGNHVARCFSMVQLGTHKDEYMGKERIRERVRITWELSNEMREDGKPFIIGQEYSLSMSDMGNLRPMLESWRGKAFTSDEAKAFNITKVLGVPCLINIIHEKSKKDASKSYANIASITPLVSGMAIPEQINETVIITIDDFNDPELENKLPKFVFEKIKESEEYKQPTLEQEHKASIQEPIVDDIKPEDLPY